MGAVFRPKDLGRAGYRKVIENPIRDIHPDTKDSVIRLLDSWEARSEERLKEILGYDKAQDLLRSLNAKKEDERDNLNI